MRDRPNPFLVMAVLYLTVGFVAVITRLGVDAGLLESLPRLRWLTVHFVTIGGLTMALFGTLPTLAGVTTEHGRWGQWLLLNAGYPFVLLGMATGTTLVTVAGATAVLLALGHLTWTVWRDAPGDGRGRFYRVAPWFLVAGILLAFGMLLGVHGPGGYFGSIEGHVHANVWGFLGLVAAATLLGVLPALTGTSLRYPWLQRVTFWGLSLGAVGLVVGPWLAQHVLTFGGLAVYVVGTVALLANVVGTARAGDALRDPRVGHVLGAYLWLAFPIPWAPFVLLAPDLVAGPVVERAAINGLVFGWMLQLAMAFLPAAIAGENADPASGIAATSPGWLGLFAVNLGVAVLWATAVPGVPVSDASLSTLGFTLVAIAWASLVVTLWRSMEAATGWATVHPA
ncbi:hypothetical protein [Halorarius litoreus]|uniref:hypothetical protein n=1 Tax=Halorarius litoreus TaxID=2962676 RepID=UPI0020CBA917|nr:hypothetical protein [Halorarius litoreus]